MQLFSHTLMSQPSYENMSFCFTSISMRKPISELHLLQLPLGFDFTRNAEARSVVCGDAMTPCLQSVVHFCSSLSKQSWARSARWSLLPWLNLDAPMGGAKTSSVRNWCQIFSKEESGAMSVLQVALGIGWCIYCSGLQCIQTPIFS